MHSREVQNLACSVIVIIVTSIGILISPSFAVENQSVIISNLTSNQTAAGNMTSNQTDGSSNATSNVTDGDIIGAGRRK
jgi:hypothetical protein